MTTYHPMRSPVSIGSLLLANFAALWGFVVAPIYVVGFGLLLPYVLDTSPSSHPTWVLPLELPLIGLILGLLSVALSRCGSERHALACFWGVALNAVPLALALVLWLLRGGLGAWGL